ncbi:MAG TPA: cytochrome c biogenesis protein ResB, partial [Pseudobdellovibrionaceae bacterium]|nr:cytochrome c biogenesis protein ResB [Pseudobdellovibrionaceae bacterium]
PKAREHWDFEERPAPTPLTTSAAKIEFQGKSHWLLLNDTVRLFTENTAYLVSYLNHRIDLGFPIKLDHFEMIPYEGTQRAKEYKSMVELPEIGQVEISMNEPAVYKGLTFYQASFQNDEMGRPVASVFSVNHDPGRWLKYIGSLVMSLGVVALFWLRKVYWPPIPPEDQK